MEYTVEGGYEVEIPAVITADAATGKGEYTVKAENFVIDKTAYVTVTTDKTGELSNGTDKISFSNTLEEKNLTKTGDTLAGVIEISGTAANPGKYARTVNFSINYYSGK